MPKPYTTNIELTDGGVYDNLGLESVWKQTATVLVSDAGGRMAAELKPKNHSGGRTRPGRRIPARHRRFIKKLSKRPPSGAFDRNGHDVLAQVSSPKIRVP